MKINKTIYAIILVIAPVAIGLLLLTLRKPTEYCTTEGKCIEVTSNWKSAPLMAGSSSLILINNRNESMDIYFAGKNEWSIDPDELDVKASYSWGRVARFITNSSAYKRVEKTEFMKDRFFVPEVRVFISCTNPSCFEQIRGFSSN